MLKKLCPLAFLCLVASCSGGGGNSEGDVPGTLPQASSNSAPVIATSQINADVDIDMNSSTA